VSHRPEDCCLQLCLDDGLNHIQQQLQVLPDSSDINSCRIRASLACFQHTPTGLVPSMKLAVMLRKADKRLTSLADYLHSHTAAAARVGAAAKPSNLCTPLAVPV
jgi:hypothetical protein